MAYRKQEDVEETVPFLTNTPSDAFHPANVEMRVMGAQQQPPSYAHIPQGYYLPHDGDGLQQQQQQQQQQQHQQQPYVFAAPPSHYPYDQSQPQHQQLPFMPPPSYSNPPPPYGYPPQYPVEEPFVPADPNSRNEFFFATAGFVLGFFLPIAWCTGWLFFRSPQRGTRALARASLACICISVVMVLSVLLFMGFAILNMAPMAQCVMVNGERSANGCTSCTNIQGCGWCPSSSMCLPFDLHQGDGRRGRHGRQPPPLPPMCNGSQLIGSPDQCPPPAPSAPALSPLP